MQLAYWLKRNTRQIAIVVAPLVVVVVAVVIGQRYLQSKKDDRLIALAAINRIYEDEQRAAQTQRSELQKKISALTEDEQAQADKKKKQPNKDKSDAVQQLEMQLKAVQADHNRSFAQYQDFFAGQQTSPEGWAAGMAAVGIAIGDKKYDDARTLLATLLKHSTKNKFYQVQARLLYIKLLEEQGNIDQALTETEQIIKLAPADFKPEVLYWLRRDCCWHSNRAARH